MNCPHCGKPVALTRLPEPTDYDPSDPVQKKAFDDLIADPRTTNPYDVSTSEYFRWNRAWHAVPAKKP
jgi:hypothetical protein